MKYVKKLICILVLSGVVLGSLFVCAVLFAQPARWTPENGVWYCEELQLFISFEKDIPSYALLDGEWARCICENGVGSKEIRILCQEHGNANWYLGECCFHGKYVKYDGERYSVEDMQTKKVHVFTRVETVAFPKE